MNCHPPYENVVVITGKIIVIEIYLHMRFLLSYLINKTDRIITHVKLSNFDNQNIEEIVVEQSFRTCTNCSGCALTIRAKTL